MGKELFKNIPSKVGDLVKDVRNGRIGLPDLQRPFVWKDNKVRELFDSMLKGYPIGYIMLWESPTDYEDKKNPIGHNAKTSAERPLLRGLWAGDPPPDRHRSDGRFGSPAPSRQASG